MSPIYFTSKILDIVENYEYTNECNLKKLRETS